MRSKNLRLRAALFCSLAPLATVVSTPPVYAFSSILNSWKTTYPTSMADENAATSGSACSLCHVPNNYSQWNGYGWDLLLNGRDFRAVESLNSDNDPTGASNLDEINADTQPGWTSGANNVINGGSVTSTALPPVGIAGSLDPAVTNQPPTANPNGPYNGTEGISVIFDSSGSTDSDGSIVAYDWNFGDGSFGTGPAPSHAYISTGTFNVTLTVTDDAEGTHSATTTATIATGNQPPIADPSGPYTGAAGTSITLDGSGSTDPDGTIVAYDWDFGDGATGSGMMLNHSYAMPGTYNITLAVTDDNNATDSATTTVTIDAANQAPTADPNGPYSGMANAPVAFDGTGSTDSDGTISSYTWDFGDGNTGTGPTPTHTYIAEGTYNVALTVTDNGGLTDTAMTAAIIGAVTNQLPAANINGPYAGTVGLPITFDSAGSEDPDGILVSYDWNFGDGTTGTGSNPTHTYAAQGTYNVSLTVTDDNGAMDSSATTATVGIGNQAPIANANGPYNGTAGIPIQLDSSGSSDPDGAIAAYDWDFGDGATGTGPSPTHTYASSGTYNITLTVTDGEGATDSQATTATIAQVRSGADVFLTELWAPESIKLKKGKRKTTEIVALGNGTSISQGATVNLMVTTPLTGLNAIIKRQSVTDEVTPDEQPKQFEFNAKITCTEAGSYILGWSATISADQNSDLTNDTLVGATAVRCATKSDDNDGDEEDNNMDEEGEDDSHMEEYRDVQKGMRNSRKRNHD